jgi:preprotein translocase subunit YajC
MPETTTQKTATLAQENQAAQNMSTPQSATLSIMPLVFIFLVAYFLLIRPQKKQMQEHDKLISELKKGDKVITAGGIVGILTKVEKDKPQVEVEIASNVKIHVVKDSVIAVINDVKGEK